MLVTYTALLPILVTYTTLLNMLVTYTTLFPMLLTNTTLLAILVTYTTLLAILVTYTITILNHIFDGDVFSNFNYDEIGKVWITGAVLVEGTVVTESSLFFPRLSMF